jgi:UDPglucose 6-dehydrogenase
MQNTDAMAQAQRLELILALLLPAAMVRAHDPVAIEEAKRVLGPREGLSYADTPLKACEDADALVIVTEWSEFRSPDFDALKAALRTPVLFDGRNLFAPELLRGLGFEYHSIGRGVSSNAHP